jgi:CRP-like cAMP-binding protein
MKVHGVFRSATATRKVPAGLVIFEAGAPGEEMFGVIEGEVEIRTAHGTVYKLGPDDTFGEMSIVDSSPRSATAQAITDTKLAVIDRKMFLFLVHETPMFALQIMSTMAQRLRRGDLLRGN